MRAGPDMAIERLGTGRNLGDVLGVVLHELAAHGERKVRCQGCLCRSALTSPTLRIWRWNEDGTRVASLHTEVRGPVGQGFLGPLDRLCRWLHVGSCLQPQHRPPLPSKRNCSQPGNARSVRSSRACARWQQKRQRQSGTVDAGGGN